jgi:hypothetical protein
LHLTFIGGFALMTFAMGTMVVMSHSGEARRLKDPLWVLRIAGAGLAVALLARVTADARFERYFEWLAAASLGWLIAGAAWILFASPRLARLAPDADFERMHEAAKTELRLAAAPGPRANVAPDVAAPRVCAPPMTTARPRTTSR